MKDNIKVNDGIVPVSSGTPSGGVSDYGEKGIGQGDDHGTPSHPTPPVESSIDSWTPRVK